MIEYQDGSTSEIGDLNEILGQFVNELEKDDEQLEETPAALHVRDKDELEAKKTDTTLQQRLDDLEKQVEKMKAIVDHSSSPRSSRRVAAASPEEVVQFSDQSVIQ